MTVSPSRSGTLRRWRENASRSPIRDHRRINFHETLPVASSSVIMPSLVGLLAGATNRAGFNTQVRPTDSHPAGRGVCPWSRKSAPPSRERGNIGVRRKVFRERLRKSGEANGRPIAVGEHAEKGFSPTFTASGLLGRKNLPSARSHQPSSTDWSQRGGISHGYRRLRQ